MVAPDADVLEDFVDSLAPGLLSALLKDHTRSKGLPDGAQANIFWATGDYEHLGPAYAYDRDITPDLISGPGRGGIIVPRCLKGREAQVARSKGMAEVFTPSWVCNAQNNLVDDAWFGRHGVFNAEVLLPDGRPDWEANTERVRFPEGKTWQDYVLARRMEIACGEAPYLVSRYDTTTGRPIAVANRIGLLDRKLRVVSENCHSSAEWLEWAKKSLMSVYAFEWQGNNLLLAREAVLMAFIEAYQDKFGTDVPRRSLPGVAYIVSWNLWQMDGTKGVVPNSCDNAVELAQPSLFSQDAPPRLVPCKCRACANGEQTGHKGIRCLVKDWKSKKELVFDDIIHRR